MIPSLLSAPATTALSFFALAYPLLAPRICSRLRPRRLPRRVILVLRRLWLWMSTLGSAERRRDRRRLRWGGLLSCGAPRRGRLCWRPCLSCVLAPGGCGIAGERASGRATDVIC